MRICFVTTEYPPEVYWGGIAIYTHTMAHAMAERGHEVHVVAKTLGEARDESSGSVRVHWITERRPTWLKPVRYLRLGSEWMVHFGRNVARKIAETQRHCGAFDVIEAPETQAAGLWLKGPCRSRLVTVLHNPGYKTREFAQEPGHGLDHRIRDYLERRQTIHSAAIVSPSAILADVIARDWRIPRERITVIHNPTPPLPAAEDPGPYNSLLAGREYMLFFGRLQTLKGVHVIAEALPAIFRQFPRIDMVFVARDMPYRAGTMKQHILERCKGFEARLVFIEKLPKEQLVPIIRHANLCVLPSLWEAFQLTCVESLSLGKITIASRNTGAQEIIEDGVSGFLVEPGDHQRLETTILRTLALPEHEMQKMREVAVQRSSDFLPDRIIPRKLDFFNALRKTGGTQVKDGKPSARRANRSTLTSDSQAGQE